MGSLVPAVYTNIQRHLRPPAKATLTHSPIGRTVGSQDTVMPLSIRFVFVKRLFVDHIGMSDMLDRTQRTRQERPVCAPLEKFGGERSGDASERQDLRP